jgi:DNA-binding XRE family transcriptional regulator
MSRSAQDACDAAHHAQSMAALARGEEELLTSAEALAFARAPTPLAFWRRKRDMTQAALGKLCGVTQSYIASLESGARKGDPALFKRLATALRVRMDDLVEA